MHKPCAPAFPFTPNGAARQLGTGYRKPTYGVSFRDSPQVGIFYCPKALFYSAMASSVAACPSMTELPR